MRCDYCGEPGKRFTIIGPLSALKHACQKCKGKAYAKELDAERNRRAKQQLGTPCADYVPNDDEGVES